MLSETFEHFFCARREVGIAGVEKTKTREWGIVWTLKREEQTNGYLDDLGLGSSLLGRDSLDLALQFVCQAHRRSWHALSLP